MRPAPDGTASGPDGPAPAGGPYDRSFAIVEQKLDEFVGVLSRLGA